MNILQDNINIVFFIYGLAFFVMGVVGATLLQLNRKAGMLITFWPLVVFGILHGIHAWLDMLVLNVGISPGLMVAKWIFLFSSFFFFFDFGWRLFKGVCKASSGVQKILAQLCEWWLAPLIGVFIVVLSLFSADSFHTSLIWTRYLFGFLGGILAGLGFRACYYNDIGSVRVKKYFGWIGGSLLLYGVFGGVFVPQADFFPANIINTKTFLSLINIPVQVFRAICAIIMAWAATQIILITYADSVFFELQDNIKKSWEAEEELFAQNKFLQEILDSLNQPFYVIDINNYNIIKANKAAYSLGLITKNTKCYNLTHRLNRPCSEANVICPLEEIKKANTPIVVEHMHSNKDGEVRCFEVHGYPVFDAQGNVDKVLEYSADITERKQAEKDLLEANRSLRDNEKALKNMLSELRQTNEELKEAQGQLIQSEKLAAIGQLAAGIAHEINNPVGFVSSNFEILRQYVDGYSKFVQSAEGLEDAVKNKDKKKIVSALTDINEIRQAINFDFIATDIENLLNESKEGIERIKKIVLDLRSFSRKGDEEIEIVNVEDVLDSVINIIFNEIKYKAELKKEYGGIPVIRGNTPKLSQVFLNILINAAQSIDKKGVIIVRTEVIDDSVHITIEDNGCGIPDGNLNKIFDAFFTTKVVGEGTGLGLSISYDIIKQMGARMKVESEVKKGTKFIIIIPILK